MTGFPFIVRRYAQADLEGAVALFGRAVHETAAADYTAEQLAAWAPEPPDLEDWRVRLAGGEVLVAEQEGRLLGFIRFEQAERCVLIDLLYVLPEAQRHGIATALLERARGWAQQRQLDGLVADVSLTARPFMMRHGFTVAFEQSVDRHGVALRRFRMQRSLKGGGS